MIFGVIDNTVLVEVVEDIELILDVDRIIGSEIISGFEDGSLFEIGFSIESELDEGLIVGLSIGVLSSLLDISSKASVLAVGFKFDFSLLLLDLELKFNVDDVNDLSALQRLDVDFDLDDKDDSVLEFECFGETDLLRFGVRTLNKVLGTGLGGKPNGLLGLDEQVGGRDFSCFVMSSCDFIGVLFGDDVIDEADETPEDEVADIADMFEDALDEEIDEPKEFVLVDDKEDLSDMTLEDEIDDLADETLPADKRLALVVL